MKRKCKCPEGFLGKEEAAKLMGCQSRTIDNWMKWRMIPFYKFGKRVFFKKDDLFEAVTKHKIETKKP
jgi:excisionase family DNA binding protein